MNCGGRAWQQRNVVKGTSGERSLFWRSGSRPVVAAASKTAGPGTPLSLSDIIAFESDLPKAVVPEAAREARVEALIDRASRVLRDVSSVLEQDEDKQQHHQRLAAPSASSVPLAAHGGNGDQTTDGVALESTLSRAVFGRSAQVSERQGELTRQALQKTLEGAAGGRWELVGGGAGRDEAGAVAAAAPLAAPAAADQENKEDSGPGQLGSWRAVTTAGRPAEDVEQPAWARALFSSATTTSAPSPSTSSSPVGGSPSRPGSSGGSPAPPSAPAASSSSPPPALQPAARRPLADWAPLAFAEADLSVPTELRLKSEDALLSAAADVSVLPPLQSVVDLTAAARPPTQGLDLGGGSGQVVLEAVAVSELEVTQQGALGRRLQDGVGRLADGTRFEKLSGTDTGPDGYVKKWEVLRGVTGDGRVQWEECWWQASNRYGLREMGAFKKGTAESGASWVEEWKEVLHTHPTNLRLVIERTAHKWARDENNDEWEEKWGESFEEAGRVQKWADKWAKAGINVWHERWGEDYDGRGACQKWTDKWAERLLPDGGQEQWGDKWTETFGHGKGTKHGEVWSSSGGGRYNRWWNEEHYGDGHVRKWGNSTSGEYWDTVEAMDTYYNPVPHFGFKHAVSHSPQLWAVPLPAPDEGDSADGDDGLGVGLDRL